MDNQLLLKIARNVIASKYDNNIAINKQKLLNDYPYLKELGATFVTLNLDGKLRGCVGTLEATHCLLDDLMVNANNAAFHDPRFLELSEEEFNKIDLEISILSEAVKVEYKDLLDLKLKIKPFVHGVILTNGINRSTFLPQVWEQLPKFEDFFTHLCLKGNFPEDCFSSHPDVFVYEVQKVK